MFLFIIHPYVHTDDIRPNIFPNFSLNVKKINVYGLQKIFNQIDSSPIKLEADIRILIITHVAKTLLKY